MARYGVAVWVAFFLSACGGVARDAFHVVVPSLPGFGFSGKPRETGWGVPRIAAAWAQLMVDGHGVADHPPTRNVRGVRRRMRHSGPEW